MNQTVKGAMKPVQSAFGFIKSQVDTFTHVKKKEQIRRKQIMAKWLTASFTAYMAFTTVLPQPMITQAQEVETPSVFDTSVRLDKNSPSLLVIEEAKPEITVGKSLAQEQAETQARQMAAQKARQASTSSVPSNDTTRVKAASADEAHQMAQVAAAQAGIPNQWKFLAAVWQVESGKLVQGCVRGGGAVGPMQFLPSTYRAYAADGDGDGQSDICNAKDALVAAAKLLKNGGIADGRVDQAIHNYNHSMAYVNHVKKVAETIN